MENFCLRGLCSKKRLPGLVQSQGLSAQGAVRETPKTPDPALDRKGPSHQMVKTHPGFQHERDSHPHLNVLSPYRGQSLSTGISPSELTGPCSLASHFTNEETKSQRGEAMHLTLSQGQLGSYLGPPAPFPTSVLLCSTGNRQSTMKSYGVSLMMKHDTHTELHKRH